MFSTFRINFTPFSRFRTILLLVLPVVLAACSINSYTIDGTYGRAGWQVYDGRRAVGPGGNRRNDDSFRTQSGTPDRGGSGAVDGHRLPAGNIRDCGPKCGEFCLC